MPPLPKRRYSKARHGKRKSHQRANRPSVEACPRCHRMKLTHRVCPTCGNYRGEEVITPKIRK